ncbi:reverse transcriptase domain-containing protein [Tanacetum coccineum]
MHTRASNSELVEPLLEPERTLNRRRRRRNRRVPFDQRNNPPKNPRIVYPPILDINHFRHFLVTLENLYPMDDEPMWAADRVVALTPGCVLLLISMKLGRPIMLDAYTSNMCVKYWGRKTYTRVLIKVSAKNALLDSLIVAIPFPNGMGHTIENIDVEYEWQPPQCGSCKIFDHNHECCPKAVRAPESTKAYDDGPTNENGEASISQLNTKKDTSDPLPDLIGKKEQELNLFLLKNYFDALSKEDNVFESNNDERMVTNELASSILDSENEEVEEVFVEKDLYIEPMDEVVDDAQKKVEAPPTKIPKKTGICSGRKSPKRNVAVSPKMKVHYFDREDIEEVEYENASITRRVDGLSYGYCQFL